MEGVHFVYQPEAPNPPKHLEKDLEHIQQQLEAQGATLRPSTCPEHLNNATYAVCSFADALIAHWAQLHGVEVVSWLYVLDCLAQRRRLATDHVYYKPLPVPRALPNHDVQPLYCTFTAIKGVQRELVFQLLVRLGIACAAAPTANRLTHIIAGNVHDTTSQKIIVAKRSVPNVAVVNVLWVLDCALCRCVLPPDSYTMDNPPSPLCTYQPPAQPHASTRTSSQSTHATDATAADEADEDHVQQRDGGVQQRDGAQESVPINRGDDRAHTTMQGGSIEGVHASATTMTHAAGMQHSTPLPSGQQQQQQHNTQQQQHKTQQQQHRAQQQQHSTQQQQVYGVSCLPNSLSTRKTNMTTSQQPARYHDCVSQQPVGDGFGGIDAAGGGGCIDAGAAGGGGGNAVAEMHVCESGRHAMPETVPVNVMADDTGGAVQNDTGGAVQNDTGGAVRNDKGDFVQNDGNVSEQQQLLSVADDVQPPSANITVNSQQVHNAAFAISAMVMQMDDAATQVDPMLAPLALLPDNAQQPQHPVVQEQHPMVQQQHPVVHEQQAIADNAAIPATKHPAHATHTTATAHAQEEEEEDVPAPEQHAPAKQRAPAKQQRKRPATQQLAPRNRRKRGVAASTTVPDAVDHDVDRNKNHDGDENQAPDHTTKPQRKSNVVQRTVHHTRQRKVKVPTRSPEPDQHAPTHPSPPPPVCIVLSGMHTAEQQKTTRLLKQLGMPADYIVRGNDTHGWDVRATHVVMPVLKRVTKSLGAMAAGCWLVSSAFVEESAKRRAFQHPVAYELKQCSRMDPGAPAFWRQRRESTGNRAFEGLQVALHGFNTHASKENALTMQVVQDLLQAGGAQHVTGTSHAGKVVELVVVGPNASRTDAFVAWAIKHKIPCMSAESIVDWLAFPKTKLDLLNEGLMFGTRATRCLKLHFNHRHQQSSLT